MIHYKEGCYSSQLAVQYFSNIVNDGFSKKGKLLHANANVADIVFGSKNTPNDKTRSSHHRLSNTQLFNRTPFDTNLASSN